MLKIKSGCGNRNAECRGLIRIGIGKLVAGSCSLCLRECQEKNFLWTDGEKKRPDLKSCLTGRKIILIHTILRS